MVTRPTVTQQPDASRPVYGHSLVIREGTWVRLTWSPRDSPATWLQGRVQATSAGGRLLLLPEGEEQPTTVLLDASSHLEHRAGRRASWWLGGVTGGVLGTLVGAVVLSGDFGNVGTQGGAFERSQGALLGGAVGAVLGLGVAHLLGRDRWSPVPLRGGYVATPPLTIPWRRAFAAPTSTQRWTWFPSTFLDFSAFFTTHADSLMPVEGVWEQAGGPRYAIVRDQRYVAYEYVAVRLLTVMEGGRPPSGPVFAGLRAGDDAWDVTVLDRWSTHRGRTLRGTLHGPVLRLMSGAEWVTDWVRVVP